MHSIRRSFSFSNVIAMIALFAALTGGAYAAGKISGSKIKPHSIPLNRLKGTLPSGPAAYGHVNANGTVDTPNSKHIGALQTGQPGYYCVTPSVTVHNVVVTADVAGGLSSATASFSDPFTSCPDGDVVVSTFNSAGSYTSTPFWIEIN